MLSSVLNIIAKPLEHALRTYQRREPKSQEIEPLLRVLKDSLPLSRRTGGADHNELEAWTSMPGGGLGAAIQHTMQGFVQWSLHPAVNVMPTSYTHRQVLVGLRVLTARRVLYLILDEVRREGEGGGGGGGNAHGPGAIVYDVAAALICAPDATNFPQEPPVDLLDGSPPPPTQRRIGLREALRAEAEDCRKIQKTDPVLAEIVVRLHRRVEAHMAVSEAEAILHGDLVSGLGGLEAAAAAAAGSIDDAMVAAAAASAGVGGPGEGITVDTVGLDLGLGAADMGLAGASSAGGSLDLGRDAGGLFDLDMDGSMDIDWGEDMTLG